MAVEGTDSYLVKIIKMAILTIIYTKFNSWALYLKMPKYMSLDHKYS